MWTFTAVTVAAIGRRSAATFTVGHNTLTATPVLELFGSALPIVGCKRLHLIRHAQGTHNLAEEKVQSSSMFGVIFVVVVVVGHSMSILVFCSGERGRHFPSRPFC